MKVRGDEPENRRAAAVGSTVSTVTYGTGHGSAARRGGGGVAQQAFVHVDIEKRN
jgi:hypothetical protein